MDKIIGLDRQSMQFWDQEATSYLIHQTKGKLIIQINKVPVTKDIPGQF